MPPLYLCLSFSLASTKTVPVTRGMCADYDASRISYLCQLQEKKKIFKNQLSVCVWVCLCHEMGEPDPEMYFKKIIAVRRREEVFVFELAPHSPIAAVKMKIAQS
jgi:hypothetical protein